MEVADQWRREWAGTAEYGKVTEGGVTRRIARAMEVLHASAPGARVRVMRAAYHSTAGPGAPASSFMLHSSRRVISSGFNFLESPSTPTKPLELSSTPFGSSQESNGEIENYKVTEPDDIEISEPSKWRSSTGASTIRMPSEESSSTDNASIIDLDLRAKNLHRKYSYDSENSDIQWGKKNSARASPLLDAPVTLSTLKYKSLLNGSNEWNNRRKSYSFEDTSPLNETTLHSNDTFAMESSTDSGICKSSEIVNDHLDDNTHAKYVDRKERRGLTQDESFKDWLHKNRPSSFYKGNHFKSYREHDIVMEDPVESNITLQSTGKVSITLPVTIETDDDYQYKKTHISEDSDRRVKKVEFCKTEVHFTAESGKVNIIATDEKPPPSNDFRKRRSAFVPMNDMMDKPITLFGEKINDLFETNRTSDLISSINSEFIESDENTAATKSILKNKIPKPKPYLLGENMVIGLTSDLSSKDPLNEDISVLTGVSLINRQLQSEKRYDGEITSVLSSEKDKLSINNIDYRTANKGPYNKEGLKQEMYAITKVRSQKSNNEIDTNTTGSIKNKFSALQMSPVQERLKTRQLRDSDLTYFGVDNDRKIISADIVKNTKERSYSGENSDENTFRSVKLIQQISNSVCNSEAESEDAPEYQNVPLNTSFAPIPTPRLRSKYVDKPNEIHEIKMLNPIMEQESAVMQYNDISKSRRSKHKKREETVYSTTRSLSEPPKYNSKERSHRPHDNLARGIMGRAIDDKVQEKANKCHAKTTVLINKIKQIEDDVPIYENLNSEGEKGNSVLELVSTPRRTGRRGLKVKTDTNINYHKTGSINSHYGNSNERNKLKIIKRDEEHEKELRNKQKSKKNSEESENHLHTVKPQRKINEDAPRHIKTNDKKYLIEKINTDKNNHESRSHSAHRQTNKTATRRLSRENDLEYKRSSGEISSIKTSNKHESKNRSTRSPKEKTIRESPKVQPNLNPNTELESTPNTIMLKLNDKNIPNKDSLNSHVKSKRSEYVINYDDKNGTVSSVRKIKPGPSVSKRKDNPKQIYKDIPKENTVKNKALNKIALLQLADHQRDTNRLSNANRKWKTNVHVQRSCQLL